MGRGDYVKPTLTDHGSVVSLTLGQRGSDVPGMMMMMRMDMMMGMMMMGAR